jgi:DNA-directed RNA polymerase subunit M/transcription elongation factor TFIIS
MLETLRASFVLVLIIVLAIFFTTDPTPTVAEDTTDKANEKLLNNIQSTDGSNNNNNNDKKDQKKNGDAEYLCPRCSSHSLTFEGLSTYEGNVIQLINCSDCSFEWQETWTLSNWLWLKSSSDNHWTSERWNYK